VDLPFKACRESGVVFVKVYEIGGPIGLDFVPSLFQTLDYICFPGTPRPKKQNNISSLVSSGIPAEKEFSRGSPPQIHPQGFIIKSPVRRRAHGESYHMWSNSCSASTRGVFVIGYDSRIAP